MTIDCHCGKDGHALNSVNCPVHGKRFTGLLSRAAVAVDQASSVVIVQETWDWTAPDSPFLPWPRGRVMPNPLVRQIYMRRSEAEGLGLLPRSN